jgi:hypothetical protein
MLMVALAMLFLQAVSAQAPPPQTEKFLTALHGYRRCVRTNADLFLPANESVRDTVDAAFFACANERATLIFTITDARKKSGKDDSVADAEQFVSALVDKDLREEIFVDIMRRRALHSGTANR